MLDDKPHLLECQVARRGLLSSASLHPRIESTTVRAGAPSPVADVDGFPVSLHTFPLLSLVHFRSEFRCVVLLTIFGVLGPNLSSLVSSVLPVLVTPAPTLIHKKRACRMNCLLSPRASIFPSRTPVCAGPPFSAGLWFQALIKRKLELRL